MEGYDMTEGDGWLQTLPSEHFNKRLFSPRACELYRKLQKCGIGEGSKGLDLDLFDSFRAMWPTNF